jgi:hypothetical protein
MNQYRCSNKCTSFDNSDETNHCFGLIFCTKHQMLVEPVFQEESKTLGCASHSDFQSERDKMLDRLQDELNEMGCHGDVCCLEYFKKVVAELQQQTGEP